ncbi:hypothetical protein ABIE56_000960 [Luteibacter sp. 621]|uniref:hypothetical protein n=1 Tax=Luteibacter sp. 621 TaxID=3373916 RepID=UPI003D214196
MPRGVTYGSFTARYGEKVSVDGSSSIVPTCWLRINSAKDKNDGLGGERIETEALLTPEQARVLIASLETFVASVVDDDE